MYPPLKNSDILLCMQELSIPFSDEDLQKPTPQRMQMVYEAFADILMGYTRESFDANVRACANEVENFVPPSIRPHSDIDIGHLSRFNRTHDVSQAIVFSFFIPGRLTFRVILMSQVGIQDFSIRDLIKPEALRVKTILSAVINFAKFREEQLPVFDKHVERSVQLLSSRLT